MHDDVDGKSLFSSANLVSGVGCEPVDGGTCGWGHLVFCYRRRQGLASGSTRKEREEDATARGRLERVTGV